MIASAAVATSFVLVQIDTMVKAEFYEKFGWLYTFGPEGARAVLSAIASSMITVAGLTFSVTMLTLQLASSQFGPRLLRNFMRDRGNQIVLGTFISTFVYCLLVLRTVRGTEDNSFVPHLSVAFGVLLAIASLAVLIYFIHHTAHSIRIETLLATLADQTRAAIDRLYPDQIGKDASAHPDASGPSRSTARPDAPRGGPGAPCSLPDGFERDGCTIRVPRSGYVQYVDEDALMKITVQHDLVVRVDARPGRFVTECDAVLSAWPAGRVDDETAGKLRAALIVGDERTPQQDLEFSIRRIVEIAQRALSPGINDPTTALYCIDRLGEAFGRLAERRQPSPARSDKDGHLRILTQVATLESFAGPAFAAVARYGGSDADVIGRLLDTMAMVGAKAQPEVRGRMEALARVIRRDTAPGMTLDTDREAVEAGGYRSR